MHSVSSGLCRVHEPQQQGAVCLRQRQLPGAHLLTCQTSLFCARATLVLEQNFASTHPDLAMAVPEACSLWTVDPVGHKCTQDGLHERLRSFCSVSLLTDAVHCLIPAALLLGTPAGCACEAMACALFAACSLVRNCPCCSSAALLGGCIPQGCTACPLQPHVQPPRLHSLGFHS